MRKVREREMSIWVAKDNYLECRSIFDFENQVAIGKVVIRVIGQLWARAALKGLGNRHCYIQGSKY